MKCEWCSKKIQSPRLNKRFCSTTCRVNHHNAMKYGKGSFVLSISGFEHTLDVTPTEMNKDFEYSIGEFAQFVRETFPGTTVTVQVGKNKMRATS
jgi:hypothetical protein